MSKNHNYLDAVRDGDLPSVQQYLRCPEVEINYQDAKLRSALHRVLSASKNVPQLVKLLILSGIDCDLRDEQNLTASELALRSKRDALAQLMIQVEFQGDVHARNVFYRLIRRGCMELICIYIDWKQMPLGEAVELIGEAYEALLVKGVGLGDQIKFEVQQQLVQYYSMNPGGCKRQDVGMGKDQLLEYVDLVLNNTDEDNLNEVNDVVRMAMRVLVKQLYLVKGRYEEGNLLTEVQHCLCVFVAICDGMNGVQMLKLIINKGMILSYLRLLAEQLRHPEKSKLGSRNQSVRKGLSKTFVLLKETASVFKVHEYLTVACKIDLSQKDDKELNRLALKRCLQVMGEAIKNTKRTPNISKRIQHALEQILSINTASDYRNVREFLSHGYPLAKYLLDKEDSSELYQQVQENLKSSLSFFECMLSTQLIIIYRRFIGTLYRLKNLKQVRSLAMYVDLEVVAYYQQKTFSDKFYNQERVLNLFQQLKDSLKDSPQEFSNLLKLEQELNCHFEGMSVQNANFSVLSGRFFSNLQTARGNRNREHIKKVLKLSLRQSYQKYFLNFCALKSCDMMTLVADLQTSVFNPRLSNQDVTSKLILDTVSELFTHINHLFAYGLEQIQRKRKHVKQSDSIRYIDELLQESGVSITQENIRRALQNSVEQNVFDVENRFKILGLQDGSGLAAYRSKQEIEFQAAFDRKICKLQVLILRSTQLMGTERQFRLFANKSVRFAIEYLLLEICEILLGIGFLQPNLHMMDQRVPIVCGKNLRDCLAHDSFTYSVICRSNVYLLCNALYYANSDIRLYDKLKWPKEKLYKNRHERNTSIKQKLRWIEMQNRMFEDLQLLRVEEYMKADIDRGDILGFRYETKDGYVEHRTNAIIQTMIHKPRTFAEHIDGSKPCVKIQHLINALNLPSIARKKPKQYSEPERAKILLNGALAANAFELYHELSQNLNAVQTYPIIYKQNPLVLDHLDKLKLPPSAQMLLDCIHSGNLIVFEKLLTKLDIQTVKEPTTGCSPLTVAVQLGQLEIVELLVGNRSLHENHTVDLAVSLHFNEVFKQVLPKMPEWNKLLVQAVEHDNLAAIEIMENSGMSMEVYREFPVEGNGHLLHTAAYFNRTTILQHFLQHVEWTTRIDETNYRGYSVIEIFARNGNYHAVKLLLSHSQKLEEAVALAAANNCIRIVKLILRNNPDILKQKFNELTSLAIEHKNKYLLALLLRSCECNNSNLSDQFLRAVQLCNVDAIHLLVKYDPHCSKTCNLRGHNGFHIFLGTLKFLTKSTKSRQTSLAILEQLVKYGTDATAKDHTGLTPLHGATLHGNNSMVEKLVEIAPQTINQPDKLGATPLVTALMYGDMPMVEILLQNNADTSVLETFRHPLQNHAPITTILYNDRNHHQLKYVLKTLKVNPDLTDSDGQTLLHVACQNGDLEQVTFLLTECNANVNVRDTTNGESVLHFAVRYGREDILEYLLSRNECDLEQENVQGFTPLILAVALAGRTELAQKLLIAGASLDSFREFLGMVCRKGLNHLREKSY